MEFLSQFSPLDYFMFVVGLLFFYLMFITPFTIQSLRLKTDKLISEQAILIEKIDNIERQLSSLVSESSEKETPEN
jgi:hypothetical protein